MSDEKEKGVDHGGGSGPDGTGMGNPFAGDQNVTVEHGIHHEVLPVQGMTVEQVRSRVAKRYDVDPRAEPTVDGRRVSPSHVLKAGQKLRFRHVTGEKGAR